MLKCRRFWNIYGTSYDRKLNVVKVSKPVHFGSILHEDWDSGAELKRRTETAR